MVAGFAGAPPRAVRVARVSEPGPRRQRTARCACGALTVAVQGEPVAVYACSCTNCQRRSGSAFTYAAVFREPAVSIAGAFTVWRHHADSGRWVDTAFCPTCGGRLFSRTESNPGMVGIPVGCFADTAFPPPTALYWASQRHEWLALPEGTRIVDTQ